MLSAAHCHGDTVVYIGNVSEVMDSMMVLQTSSSIAAN